MMSDPRYTDPRYDAVFAGLGREVEVNLIDRASVEIIHEDLVARYGGQQGIRDPHGLESALARPVQMAAYKETPSIWELASVLTTGIIRNHAFLDGNKRTGFQVLFVFLAINGYDLNANPADALNTIRDVASGDLDEEDFAAWISRNSQRLRHEPPPSSTP